MSTKDHKEIRNWAKTNPGINPEMRRFFTVLDSSLTDAGVWPTTTTTTTSSTTSSTTSTTA